jgi:Protein of unknown function (DUF3221)
VRLLAVAVAVALLAACGGDGDDEARTEPPDRPVDSAGPVSQVTPASLRIDAATGVVGPLAARVDEDTEVRRRRGDRYEAADLAEVRVGDPVEVWVDGPVAESSPAQAHAAFVVLDG